MPILVHRKHVHRVGQITSFNERLMFWDLPSLCSIHFIVYAPCKILRTVYDMLHVVLDEAARLHYKMIVGGDFNTELHVGLRGNFLDVFACMWRLQVANCENHDDCWTFCCSLGVERPIDFILHGMNVSILSCSIWDAFDLGSNHRVVFPLKCFRSSVSARSRLFVVGPGRHADSKGTHGSIERWEYSNSVCPRKSQRNQAQRHGTDMKHTRAQQPLPKPLRTRLAGKTSQPIFSKGFLKIMQEMDVDTAQGSTKRPAPEGTPDREAQARTKAQASDLMPRTLPTEVQEPISKVEMSAATIATLRAVMREEISIGMSALESRLTNKMDEQFIQMKQDLEQERSARTMLEERVAQLESKQAIKENTNDVTEAVDKSIAVIGGFGETTVEEAEKLAHDLLKHVHGFHEVSMVDGNSIVGLAQFDTPANAMKLIKSQKKHPQIQTNELWVAENRSRMERNQAKIASKLKKFLIELANIPKGIIVNYRLFKVFVRENGKLMPIAYVKDDLTIDWNDASNVPPMVQEAMKDFISDME